MVISNVGGLIVEVPTEKDNAERLELEHRLPYETEVESVLTI